VNEDVQVRQQVAAEHGLDVRAASFLVGSSVAELEQSALKLAELLGKQQEQERPVGLFERAAADKAERKRALVNALCGRLPQPRDTQGRWTTDQTADFHPGARQPVPQRQTHEQWLGQALADKRADVGADP
jgi:hypothetical protein